MKMSRGRLLIKRSDLPSSEDTEISFVTEIFLGGSPNFNLSRVSR